MASFLSWAKKKLQDGVETVERNVVNPVQHAVNSVQPVAHSVQQAVEDVVPAVQRNVPNVLRNVSTFSNVINPMGASLKAAEKIAPRIPELPNSNPVNRFINEAGIDQIKATVPRVTQVIQGRNPYHGTTKQVVGQISQDALNISQALPVGRVAGIATKTAPLATKITQGAKFGVKAGVGFGAAQGASTGLQQNQKAPQIVRNALVSGAAGGVLGGALGGTAPIVSGVASKTVTVVPKVVSKTPVVAKDVTQRVSLTPRANIQDQQVLRDYSDHLAGVNKAQGKELSDLIGQARSVGGKHGIDLINGSPAERMARANAVLDQLGVQNREISQGGYIKAPGGNAASIPEITPQRVPQNTPLPVSGRITGSEASLPTSVAPNAEARVFAQNPLNAPIPRAASSESFVPVSAPTIEKAGKQLQLKPPSHQPSVIVPPNESTVANNRPLAHSITPPLPQKPLPIEGTKLVRNIDKIARSTRSIVERQGSHGQELAGMLQGSRDVQEQYLAQLQKQMPTLFKIAKGRYIGKNSIVNKDFENFVDATQGLAKPKNTKIAKAVGEWQSAHPQIRQRAVNAGLNVGDLGQEYYPHFIDYQQVFKDKNTYNQAINHLVESGQAKSQEDAIKLLVYARDVSRNRQFGNLESSRIVDLPMYDKTPNSLMSYLNGSAKRIAQTETFGKQDEKALKLITNAGQEGYDTEAMKNAYDVAVGAKQYNPNTSKASNLARKYITTTRLGLGALTNVSQNVNTGVVTGHMRTLGAALKQLNPKTRAFVGDTGVIADAVLSDLKTQAGYSSFGKKALGNAINKITAPAFGTVESLNRSIAATAGGDYALRLARKGDVNTLRKLGVTGDIVGKSLSNEQLIQAARKIVEKTQFKVDPQDLPGWTDSPGGKLVAQFRTFSYAQGKFISNEVLKPMRRGNFIPFARMLAALPVGYALYETKRAIAGRPEEENPVKRGLATFQNIGGAGLAMDLYQSLNPLGSKYIPSDRRTSMAFGALGGPTAGVAAQGIGAISDLIQRKNTPTDEERLQGKIAVAKNEDTYTDATPAARFAIQQIPIAGTAIKNRLLPFQKESDADAGKTKLAKSNSSGDGYTVKGNKVYYEDEKGKAKSKILHINGAVQGDDRKILTQYATLSAKQREKKSSGEKDYDYKLAKAKYAMDKANGKIDKIDDVKRKNDLYKEKIGSTFSKETRDLFGLSKRDVYELVTNDQDGNRMVKDLVAYDDALTKAGAQTKNKFRLKDGTVAIGPAKSGGSGRGKGKSTLKQALAAFSATNAAIKPPRAPKAPNVSVKTKTTPAGYKHAPVKKYSVSKARVSKKA